MELREWLANAAAAAPTRPVAPSTGYAQGGGTPTKPGAYWYHQLSEELRAVQTAGGLAPDGAVLTQVRDAIAIMVRRQSAAFCAAGGLVDAITGAYTPAVAALADGLTLYVRAAGANTTSTPTFKADATALKTIVKGGNRPLVAGDIDGAGHWIELQYDATLDKWILLNPANGVVSGAVPIGCVVDGFTTATPAGFLICPTSLTNISRITYAALFAAIGTTFGVGDGATTFGMPWYPADYASVQANSNMGTSTVGAVISHTHNQQSNTALYYGASLILMGGDGTAGSTLGGVTAAFGGAANLAAGVRSKKFVRYI